MATQSHGRFSITTERGPRGAHGEATVRYSVVETVAVFDRLAKASAWIKQQAKAESKPEPKSEDSAMSVEQICKTAIELRDNLIAADEWTRRAEVEETRAAESRKLAARCEEQAEQAKAALRGLLAGDELPTPAAPAPASIEPSEADTDFAVAIDAAAPKPGDDFPF